MTCPECGAHRNASANFCTACGADLLTTDLPTEGPQAQTATPVQEMVGAERVEWIDRVWGSTSGVQR